jgi:hypothetical protein
VKCGKKEAIDWGAKWANFGKDKAEFMEIGWLFMSVCNQGVGGSNTLMRREDVI